MYVFIYLCIYVVLSECTKSTTASSNALLLLSVVFFAQIVIFLNQFTNRQIVLNIIIRKN